MRIVCPECGSKRISRTMGEIACRKCGFVIAENIIVSE